MEISPALAGLAGPNTAQSTERSPVITSDFETFLKMLTVQMQNQNPLDPMKSEEFAVQLATFSSLEQQVQTNDLLESLSSQMGIMGMAQFAGWVGMEARAAAPVYFDGAPITMTPNPSLTADAATLVVKNASGSEVQRVSIPVLHDSLEWTGVLADGSSLPPGIYEFTVESSSNGALASTDPVEVYARITEARNENGQTVLITSGGVQVPATSITALRDPAAVI